MTFIGNENLWRSEFCIIVPAEADPQDLGFHRGKNLKHFK